MNLRFSEKGQAVPEKTVPITGEAFEAKSGTEIYWLGNAGALINSRGTTFMIDPVLSGFDMPLLIDVPLTEEQVPRLDAVLLMIAIYEALDWTPGDHVAVKLSTGEPGSNYLRTDLIGELVQSLDDPTIVECNTAYGGSRSNTAMHYQVAEDHGYTGKLYLDYLGNHTATLRFSFGSSTIPSARPHK